MKGGIVEVYDIDAEHNITPCESIFDQKCTASPEAFRSLCVVGKTRVGEQEVSTVFLGVNHAWYEGEVVLFETLVFPECSRRERYGTWKEAEEGHWKIVNELKASLDRK